MGEKKGTQRITMPILEYWDTVWNLSGLHLIFSTEFAYGAAILHVFKCFAEIAL